MAGRGYDMRGEESMRQHSGYDLLTCQSHFSDILLVLNQSTHSEEFEAKSSSVPLRGSVLLNVTGVIRLVIAGVTVVKAITQMITRQVRNHVFAANTDGRSLKLHGKECCLKPAIVETSKIVRNSLFFLPMIHARENRITDIETRILMTREAILAMKVTV